MPWGIFVFGWLKRSELFKSWKRNNKPHPQRAPVCIPPLVYCFPIQNFGVLMRIKENSTPQNGVIYSEPAQNIQLLKHNLVKAHQMSWWLYTSLFVDIQVLLASSQGKKLISPLFLVFRSTTKHGICYDTELSYISYPRSQMVSPITQSFSRDTRDSTMKPQRDLSINIYKHRNYRTRDNQN